MSKQITLTVRGMLLLICLAWLSALAYASGGSESGLTGVGVILGDTTGFSFKHYILKDLAFDFAAGVPLGYSVNGFSTHATLMWTDEMVKVRKGALLFYFGGGACWAQGSAFSDAEVGLRTATGAEYFFSHSHFAVFAELAPTFIFTHDPGFSLHAGVGGRYYF